MGLIKTFGILWLLGVWLFNEVLSLLLCVL
jgi:hypothetical protein